MPPRMKTAVLVAAGVLVVVCGVLVLNSGAIRRHLESAAAEPYAEARQRERRVPIFVLGASGTAYFRPAPGAERRKLVPGEMLFEGAVIEGLEDSDVTVYAPGKFMISSSGAAVYEFSRVRSVLEETFVELKLSHGRLLLAANVKGRVRAATSIEAVEFNQGVLTVESTADRSRILMLSGEAQLGSKKIRSGTLTAHVLERKGGRVTEVLERAKTREVMETLMNRLGQIRGVLGDKIPEPEFNKDLETEKIRAMLLFAAGQLEQRELEKIIAMTTEEFVLNDVPMKRRELMQFAEDFLQQHQKIRVDITEKEILVEFERGGARATAMFPLNYEAVEIGPDGRSVDCVHRGKAACVVKLERAYGGWLAYALSVAAVEK